MSQIKNCVQCRYEVYLDFICHFDLTKHDHYIKYGTLYVWNKEKGDDSDGEYEEFEPIRNGIESCDYKWADEEIVTTADDIGIDEEEAAEYLPNEVDKVDDYILNEAWYDKQLEEMCIEGPYHTEEEDVCNSCGNAPHSTNTSCAPVEVSDNIKQSLPPGWINDDFSH